MAYQKRQVVDGQVLLFMYFTVVGINLDRVATNFDFIEISRINGLIIDLIFTQF